MGGICAGASSQTREDLRTFGRALGLLFQATDDLIDVEQSSEHAGKRTGKDRLAGKRTLTSILGVSVSIFLQPGYRFFISFSVNSELNKVYFESVSRTLLISSLLIKIS